ncbi:AraC family transcriptional regulator [Capnocytophaga sp.]|uniref:helix-turn-helix domain-containing protein n=1 Tax=Capnocytophaga sp. TaxID=44737 RepID=UPI0026DD5A28|nr:helix-turn-helix domain-containing protein [Capnocytophaga sp.]MDO5105420.1 helix-turn-helix domain-containing protein [Capnocytophaga sp.]
MAILIQNVAELQFIDNFSVENYCILAFCGKGSFWVDFAEYTYDGNTLLFLSPFQNFQKKDGKMEKIKLLQFHGDFYCIEYHKKEVACNGLLFNNIFLLPHIAVSDKSFNEILHLFEQIQNELHSESAYSQAVLRSYLQLILALSSKEKSLILAKTKQNTEHNVALNFQKMLEKYFLTERSVSFYAEKAHLSPDAFSKKIKLLLGKSPIKLIQERLVLEAKKQLHLTHKSVKEIAFEMNFKDEFYFSRFFKKAVGTSPKFFRETVGISVVAK